jgi:hypothetical protein
LSKQAPTLYSNIESVVRLVDVLLLEAADQNSELSFPWSETAHRPVLNIQRLESDFPEAMLLAGEKPELFHSSPVVCTSEIVERDVEIRLGRLFPASEQ